jgi:heparin binding hemagglutinin HbhA
MTSQTNDNKYPAPVYAAAGAGDYAYQKLRKLPGKVAELRERVAANRNQVDFKAEAERLRQAARRNAANLASATQAAQERAVAIYNDLVARGEHVVTGSRGPLKVKATVGTTSAPQAVEDAPEK